MTIRAYQATNPDAFVVNEPAPALTAISLQTLRNAHTSVERSNALKILQVPMRHWTGCVYLRTALKSDFVSRSGVSEDALRSKIPFALTGRSRCLVDPVDVVRAVQSFGHTTVAASPVSEEKVVVPDNLISIYELYQGPKSCFHVVVARFNKMRENSANPVLRIRSRDGKSWVAEIPFEALHWLDATHLVNYRPAWEMRISPNRKTLTFTGQSKKNCRETCHKIHKMDISKYLKLDASSRVPVEKKTDRKADKTLPTTASSPTKTIVRAVKNTRNGLVPSYLALRPKDWSVDNLVEHERNRLAVNQILAERCHRSTPIDPGYRQSDFCRDIGFRSGYDLKGVDDSRFSAFKTASLDRQPWLEREHVERLSAYLKEKDLAGLTAENLEILREFETAVRNLMETPKSTLKAAQSEKVESAGSDDLFKRLDAANEKRYNELKELLLARLGAVDAVIDAKISQTVTSKLDQFTSPKKS